MDKKKSLIYSIIAVLLIVAIVAGGTFAYFQWTSGADDKTSVNVTIEAGQITMHIEPENTIYTNLRPTNNCNNAVAYGDALATIVNNTGAMAIPSFKLSVKVTKNGTGALTSDDLKHIHYSVVLLETSSNGTKGDTVLNEGSCSNPSNFTVTEENIYFGGILTGNATGTFETVSTIGEWSDLPNTASTYLPRQFNTETVTPYGVTFLGKPHTTSYQWFRVYVWMDEGYTFTNIGNEVSDPLQNAKIEVTWSTNSMLEQVSSIIAGGDEDADEVIPSEPGLYDSNGMLITSWDELVSSGKITLDGTTITDSDKTLAGELVISDTVTKIGSMSFSNGVLTGVIIPDSVTEIEGHSFPNNKIKRVVLSKSITYIGTNTFGNNPLESIEIPSTVKSLSDSCFWHTNLTELVLPSSITFIDQSVFAYTPLTELHFEGTMAQWNSINLYSNEHTSWNNNSNITKIICSDGTIEL